MSGYHRIVYKIAFERNVLYNVFQKGFILCTRMSACMYMHHIYAWCLRRPEEVVKVTDICELPWDARNRLEPFASTFNHLSSLQPMCITLLHTSVTKAV